MLSAAKKHRRATAARTDIQTAPVHCPVTINTDTEHIPKTALLRQPHDGLIVGE
jgi:hypothetical protein